MNKQSGAGNQHWFPDLITFLIWFLLTSYRFSWYSSYNRKFVWVWKIFWENNAINCTTKARPIFDFWGWCWCLADFCAMICKDISASKLTKPPANLIYLYTSQSNFFCIIFLNRLFILEHVSLNIHCSIYIDIYWMVLEIFGLNLVMVYLVWRVIVRIREE